MIKIIRTLTPENGMKFHDICSFETGTCIGIYNHAEDRFVIMKHSGYGFNLITLPACATLDELDNAVYKVCDEHIIGVYESSKYEFIIKED